MGENVYADIDWNAQKHAVQSVDGLLRATTGRNETVDMAMFEARFAQVQRFDVDQTGFSPLMLYFLYGIGALAPEGRLVAFGLYAGIAFSMLAAGACDGASGPIEAIGVDDREDFVNRSLRNARLLGLGQKLSFVVGEPVEYFARAGGPFGVVMLDVHDAVRGKEDYMPLARLAVPKMPPGGILLAHDACVPHWNNEIEEITKYVRTSGSFHGPWTLPVDPTGVLMAVRR